MGGGGVFADARGRGGVGIAALSGDTQLEWLRLGRWRRTSREEVVSAADRIHDYLRNMQALEQRSS